MYYTNDYIGKKLLKEKYQKQNCKGNNGLSLPKEGLDKNVL